MIKNWRKVCSACLYDFFLFYESSWCKIVLTPYWNDCEYGEWMWIEVINCYEILLEWLWIYWLMYWKFFWNPELICIYINYLLLPLYEWWIIWFKCIISYKILFVIAIVCGVKYEYVCLLSIIIFAHIVPLCLIFILCCGWTLT